MFDPTQLFELTPEQQSQSDAVESIIDTEIETKNAETGATEFVFETKELSNAIKKDHGGLAVKVRTHLIDKFTAAKWKVNLDVDAGTITFKAKRTRTKKAKPADKPQVADAK